MSHRSERDFLAADLVAVSNLLATLTDDDVVSRFSLESRKHEITEQLDQLSALPPSKQAEVSLFFSGRPVDANRGITADFSAKVLSRYQDTVKKVSAFQRFGFLGDRGVVAGQERATLHVTNVVRGSFGFQLEEIEPQLTMENSTLKEAVDESTKLLLAFSSASEEDYNTGVQQIDQRVVDSISELFKLLKDESADVRVVTDTSDRWIDRVSVERALERTATIKIRVEPNVPKTGSLTGVLPTAKRFEFTIDPEETISGAISEELIEKGLRELQETWLYKEVVGYFEVRTVTRPNKEPKLFYTLERLTPKNA